MFDLGCGKLVFISLCHKLCKQMYTFLCDTVCYELGNTAVGESFWASDSHRPCNEIVSTNEVVCVFWHSLEESVVLQFTITMHATSLKRSRSNIIIQYMRLDVFYCTSAVVQRQVSIHAGWPAMYNNLSSM